MFSDQSTATDTYLRLGFAMNIAGVATEGGNNERGWGGGTLHELWHVATQVSGGTITKSPHATICPPSRSGEWASEG
jgi:hypothetical protein